ncbi:protein MFI isoform X1 [Prionailurus iriomotensis]
MPDGTEYFVRKMKHWKCFSKASVTDVLKPDKPCSGKDHKVHLSNTVKGTAVQHCEAVLLLHFISEEAATGRRTNKDISAQRIQRAWLSHMDKTIFQLLKHTIRAAELRVTHQILKEVSPLEAELVKDPSMKCKVRFRFSGETFPPVIVFKIFLHTEGHGYNYFSGKKFLKPSSERLHNETFPGTEILLDLPLVAPTVHKLEQMKNIEVVTGKHCAVADACKIMGKRRFCHQVMEEERFFQKFKITDEIDIVTLQDYMQYSSLLDETPASYGGRNNYWRKLNLKNIPRTMIIYDIVHYAESGIISHRLQKEMKYLLQKPQTEEMRKHQLRIVSEVRCPSSFPTIQPSYGPYQQQSQIQHLGRRSRQAQMKVEKMKKAYKMAKEKNASVGTEPQTDTSRTKQKKTVIFSSPSSDIMKVEPMSDEELKKEEKELFAWCQGLCINSSPSY